MLPGGTARYLWNFPICPIRVTIDLSVVRALQHDLAAPGDQQGLLFGRETEGSTHINGRERVAAAGREALASAMAGARRKPVGFYRMRHGRAFILTSEEIEIGTQLFTAPGALALLVERRTAGAGEATFFFRRGDSFVHNLPMPFPLDAERLADGDAPTAPAKPAKPPVGRRRAAAIAAGVVMAAGLIAVAMRVRATPTSAAHPKTPAVPHAAIVEAAPAGTGLEFVWDPKSMPAATAGLLEIDDGGVKQQIPLDADQLRAGSLPYTPASDRVRVELSTLQRDGRIVDASVSARRSTVAVAPSLAPAPPARPVSAPVEEKAPAPVPEKAAPEKSAPPAPVVSSADRKAAPRPFTLEVRRIEAPAQPVGLEPPPIERAPLTSSVLPIVPALPPHLPPPAPARTAVHSGRLIWTGTLPRRGVVEFDGRSASPGSISGALPGVPVAVSISPAEFEGDGLVVYTTEAARNNRVDPASTSNGWNKVKWVWDPERVREIALLEPPNASNGYKRLAFRSDARRVSIVWIDWRAR
jgi:hypothetical protein